MLFSHQSDPKKSPMPRLQCSGNGWPIAPALTPASPRSLLPRGTSQPGPASDGKSWEADWNHGSFDHQIQGLLTIKCKGFWPSNTRAFDHQIQGLLTIKYKGFWPSNNGFWPSNTGLLTIKYKAFDPKRPWKSHFGICWLMLRCVRYKLNPTGFSWGWLQSTDPEAFSNLDWTENGKHTKNYGKSQFLMGKSIISMAIFNSYVCLPEGISQIGHP